MGATVSRHPAGNGDLLFFLNSLKSEVLPVGLSPRATHPAACRPCELWSGPGAWCGQPDSPSRWGPTQGPRALRGGFREPCLSGEQRHLPTVLAFLTAPLCPHYEVRPCPPGWAVTHPGLAEIYLRNYPTLWGAVKQNLHLQQIRTSVKNLQSSGRFPSYNSRGNNVHLQSSLQTHRLTVWCVIHRTIPDFLLSLRVMIIICFTRWGMETQKIKLSRLGPAAN